MEALRCLVGSLGSEVGRGASGRQLHAQPSHVGKGQVGRVCEQPVGSKDKHIRTREELGRGEEPDPPCGFKSFLECFVGLCQTVTPMHTHTVGMDGYPSHSSVQSL